MAAIHTMPVNHVTPLFPRGSMREDMADTAVRDLQAFPRHIREVGSRQELRRTAPVKHHLRAMVDRGEMFTTYEHDFGLATRAKPRSSSAAASEAGRSPAHSSVPSRHSTGTSYRSREASEGSAALAAGVSLGATLKDPAGTSGPATPSKLRAASTPTAPLRVTVRGAAPAWTPHSHPSMIMGMSTKRVGLLQTVNTLGLRSSEVPFSTR
eukprot:CAMPEP_0175249628 /NCGR_PEP_ID=MMETSP0093-20121207/34740_1 /TAXON_ID=311494 /ORGANISM="Alexandrium monilatum, Strain CCMP3105" /LENGTH=209 /DNA_ID=CAMNT_0016543857 /DNA_START=93 /DNA_END=722 /DNA_ORIENTATION=+